MKFSRLLLFPLLLILSSQSYATIIETVHLEFESGAEWNGTITFNDGYEGMIATEGYLTGGVHSFNEYFSWTWWHSTSQPNPQDFNSDGYYTDWLMNLAYPDYTMYIGLSWDVLASVAAGSVQFVLLQDNYYSGNQAYDDLLTDYSVDVPAPAGVGLIALGLLALMRRRA